MKRFSALMLASVSAVSFGGAAFAQDVPANGAAADGEILVTARRMEERLQDVPISITVMSQQQLANRNIVDSTDLARYVPSLSANANFGSDNTTFAIRGFVQDIGSAPSVGTYFADVVSPRGGFLGYPVGDGAGPGSFFDLQNVQVLKGPQGTLQGRNTTGGAVLLVPQKPTHDLEGYVQGGIGNFDMMNIQGVLNVPLSDTFRVRLGVDRMKRDGYLRNTTTDMLGSHVGPDAYGNVDYTAVRASVVADLTPDLENYTIVSYLDSRNNGNIQPISAVDITNAPLGLLAQRQLASQVANGDGFYDIRSSLPNSGTRTKQWQVINTTTWQASDNLTIKNIASYAQLRQVQSSPQFGTDFIAGAVDAGARLYLSAIQAAPGLASSNQSTFTEEFQLQGKNGDLTWQTGAYYERSDPLGLTGVMGPTPGLTCFGSPVGGDCLAGAAGGNPFGGLNYHDSRSKTQSIGLYAQATYALTDQLNLTGGFRYTWDKVSDTSRYMILNGRTPDASAISGGRVTGFDNINNALAAGSFFCVRDDNIDPANCISTLRKKSSAPTWLINLDYKPTDDIMLYAKYARGYRTGGVSPTAPMFLLTYEPEKVDAFEIGAKTAWNGTVPGSLNLAAFYNNLSNQQLFLGSYSTIGLPATGAIANAGKSRVYGLEADLHVGPVAGFALDVNYTYLNTKLKSLTGFANGDPLDDFGGYNAVVSMHVGSQLLLAPKHKLTATGSYTLPLNEDIGKITLAATYTYQSSQQSNYSSHAPTCVSWSDFPAYLGGDTSVTNCIQGTGRLASYGLLNLNANWASVAGSPVDLSLFMTNVTKKKYYAFHSGTMGYGFETSTVGAPRMFGARAKVSF